MTCKESITVSRQAVDWLKENYPQLCIKAGLCERVAGRLYTKTLSYPPPQQQAEPVAYIHRQGNHWEVSERCLVDDEKARGWTEEPLYTTPPQRKPLEQQAEPDRWVIEKIGDKLLLNGKEIDPGTIEVRLDGLTYRSSEKVEVRQQAEPECWCHKCNENNVVNNIPFGMTRMIVCPTCGNKRCPKASDHRLDCTGSNETGQPGSVYTAPPQRKPLTDEDITKVIDSMPRGINGWMSDWDLYEFTRAIEWAHGIKEQP
jgi:Zn finger protein HypA/HybF involved in hydrogenase expression